jgi:hypothetical protein
VFTQRHSSPISRGACRSRHHASTASWLRKALEQRTESLPECKPTINQPFWRVFGHHTDLIMVEIGLFHPFILPVSLSALQSGGVAINDRKSRASPNSQRQGFQLNGRSRASQSELPRGGGHFPRVSSKQRGMTSPRSCSSADQLIGWTGRSTGRSRNRRRMSR